MTRLPCLTTLMTDKDIRRAFGTRLKELRKTRRWTQKQLAEKLGVRFQQLNKYECGLNVPPVEKLILMGQIFETSVDYLLTGTHVDRAALNSIRLLDRLKQLEQFTAEDQEIVIKLLDAMILKERVEGVLKPTAHGAGGQHTDRG